MPTKVHGVDLSHMSKDVLAANRATFAHENMLVPVDGAEIAEKIRSKDEKQLQRLCEQLLEQRGFLRLTVNNAQRVAGTKVGGFAKPECNGWYIHLHKTKRNPLMPDLIVIAHPNNRPPLMVELKCKLRYRPGQREMIGLAAWRLCCTFVDFDRLLTNWSEKP